MKNSGMCFRWVVPFLAFGILVGCGKEIERDADVSEVDRTAKSQSSSQQTTVNSMVPSAKATATASVPSSSFCPSTDYQTCLNDMLVALGNSKFVGASVTNLGAALGGAINSSASLWGATAQQSAVGAYDYHIVKSNYKSGSLSNSSIVAALGILALYAPKNVSAGVGAFAMIGGTTSTGMSGFGIAGAIAAASLTQGTYGYAGFYCYYTTTYAPLCVSFPLYVGSF